MRQPLSGSTVPTRPEFLPGWELAAAQFRVTAITSTDENSNNNTTVTGSNEQAYNASLTTAVAAGTNFASGRIRLEPGSSLVGWVSFELPDGVRIAKGAVDPVGRLQHLQRGVAGERFGRG